MVLYIFITDTVVSVSGLFTLFTYKVYESCSSSIACFQYRHYLFNNNKQISCTFQRPCYFLFTLWQSIHHLVYCSFCVFGYNNQLSSRWLSVQYPVLLQAGNRHCSFDRLLLYTNIDSRCLSSNDCYVRRGALSFAVALFEQFCASRQLFYAILLCTLNCQTNSAW